MATVGELEPASPGAQEGALPNTWQVESDGVTHSVRVDTQGRNTHVLVLVDEKPAIRIRKPRSNREWTRGNLALGASTVTVALRLSPQLVIDVFVDDVSQIDGSSLEDFRLETALPTSARAYDQMFGTPSFRRLRNVLASSIAPGLVGFGFALRSMHGRPVVLIETAALTWALFGTCMVGIWAVNVLLLGHPELPDRVRFPILASSFAVFAGLVLLLLAVLQRLQTN